MGKVLRFLDGWKLFISVGIIFAAKVWDGANNGHAGDMIGNLLNILGWGDGVGTLASPEQIGVAAAGVLGVWGFLHKIYKAFQQKRSGVQTVDLLTNRGAVDQYIHTGRE